MWWMRSLHCVLYFKGALLLVFIVRARAISLKLPKIIDNKAKQFNVLLLLFLLYQKLYDTHTRTHAEHSLNKFYSIAYSYYCCFSCVVFYRFKHIIHFQYVCFDGSFIITKCYVLAIVNVDTHTERLHQKVN